MHEDFRSMLNAYVDGEIHGSRLEKLTSHLASCDSCQMELDELRQVSSLLKSVPEPDFMPVERFVAVLNLRLPRQAHHEPASHKGSLVWWLIPAGLLGAWFFVQTVFIVANLVSTAGITGVLGNAISFSDGARQTLWFAMLTSFSGTQSGGFYTTLTFLNRLDILGVNMLVAFLGQTLIVLLYWGWFLLWWFRFRPRRMVKSY